MKKVKFWGSVVFLLAAMTIGAAVWAAARPQQPKAVRCLIVHVGQNGMWIDHDQNVLHSMVIYSHKIQEDSLIFPPLPDALLFWDATNPYTPLDTLHLDGSSSG